MAGGPCTSLQSRPPAFLDIPSVTVDALHVHRGDSARPPAFPGAPHTLVPDNLIGINSNSFQQASSVERPVPGVLSRVIQFSVFPSRPRGLQLLPPWRGKVGMGGRSTVWA
jgi:hypothetical protein